MPQPRLIIHIALALCLTAAAYQPAALAHAREGGDSVDNADVADGADHEYRTDGGVQPESKGDAAGAADNAAGTPGDAAAVEVSQPAREPAKTPLPARKLDYELEFECESGDIAAYLRSLSTLYERRDRPPATMRGLRGRIESDHELFEKALRSRGYYHSAVEISLEDERDPLLLRIRVDPGPLYRIIRYDVFGLPPVLESRSSEQWSELLGVGPHSPASADAVVGAEQKLILELLSLGYPFARVSRREIEVEHADRSMHVSLYLDPGLRARLGKIRVTGLREVEEKFVRRRIVLSEGDAYDPAKIEESRHILLSSGVFASVRIIHGDSLDGEGRLPITIEVTESKSRTIGAGVRYSSSEGFGGRAYWEHRNVMGGGERLKFSARASEIFYGSNLDYREPDFLEPGQDLLLDLSFDVQDTDAFRSEAIVLSAGVERRLLKTLSAGLGVTIERSVVDDLAVLGGGSISDTFDLIGFPLSLRYDSSDDMLDPSRGQRITATLTPYSEAIGSDVGMMVSRVSESFYIPLAARKKLVFAARVTAGSIAGVGDAAVPANKRFYAGGGDSVRGYDFQLAGPLDEDGDPLGGRSLLQFGCELRWRATPTIGVVPFVEAASISQDILPDLAGRLFWGAGLGIRYFTAVGPMRVDVALPLDKRPGVDDAFEIYISLGQSF